MKLPIYQVDAFADQPFTGNPAAVCPLETWLPDSQMQAIAEENNLAETAFFVREGSGHRIRWFTPAVEVDLCGHATLAAAHILWSELGWQSERIEFESRSGVLSVQRKSGRIELDFPAEACEPCDIPPALLDGLGVEPRACYFNQDYLVVLHSEEAVRTVVPNIHALSKLVARGIIITAAAQDYDFVCRFFGPAVGIEEDAVTGSAFTKLVPYWADKLGKSSFAARQVSPRGGDVWCELDHDRVRIAGTAVTFLSGEINIAQSTAVE